MLKVYLAPKPEAITNNLQKVQTQKKISQPLKAVTLQKYRATGSQNIGKNSEGVSHQSSMEISAGKSASPLPQNRISPEAVLESARHFAIEEVRKQAPSKEKICR